LPSPMNRMTTAKKPFFGTPPGGTRGPERVSVGEPIQNERSQNMNTNFAFSRLAGRRSSTGYPMKPDSLFWHLAGNSPGVLLWLAVLPLVALGQANYATPYTFTTLAGMAGVAGSADGTGSTARFRLAEAGAYSLGGVAVDSAGNLYVADAFNDTIRKGFPASSVPPPILGPPSLSAGQFGFGVTGLPGLAVNLESSTNLSSWQLTTAFILVGGTNYYSASPNPSLGARFYRAQVR
jgi:hypothetical protein